MLSGAPFAPSLPPGTFGALALVRQANAVVLGQHRHHRRAGAPGVDVAAGV